MSDILSGGRIDGSTSGPIPSKEDDRKRDILAEQRENQRQDAIGGTEEPPKPRPAELIPDPPQVAPPLPVIPSFDFSIAGSALEETREIARQTVFDVIKNVTINGQGPSIEGSTISFNIPQQPPASEVFIFQGVAIPQSQIPQIIQPPTIPQPQTPQPEAVQEIQSVVVAPPSRTRAQQITAITEEREEVREPSLPTKVIPPKIGDLAIPMETEEPKILTTATISVAPAEYTEEPTVATPLPATTSQIVEKIATEPEITTTPILRPPSQEEIQTPQTANIPNIPNVRPQEVKEPQEVTQTAVPIVRTQEEVQVLTTSTSPPKEEVERSTTITAPTVSIIPTQEEPIEQPRVTTTPSISVVVPQEEVEQPQEQASQPQRSTSVQVPQTEEYEVEESRVPAVSSTQQQPIRLEETKIETNALIAETPENLPTQDIVRIPATQTAPTQTASDQTIEVPKPEPTTPPSLSGEPKNELIGEKQDKENNERSARDRQIRSAIGLGELSPFDEPPEIAPNKAAPIGEKQDAENFERDEINRKIRSDLGLGEISPFDEETESERGYKAAEARYRQRRESDPDFDRESDVRQKGERYSDFKERQETLKEERAERAEIAKEKAELSKRLKEGGIAETPSGMVPVALTRADGQKKILAYLASEFVGVVEGTGGGERQATLPSEDSYYEAGGGGECNGLGLYTKTVGTTTEVWVSAGTVAGELPSGFDPNEGKNIDNGGSGFVWAEVNVNQTTGTVVSSAVAGGGSPPNNTDTAFYITLGYYEYDGDTPTVTNYGCGSVNVTICRNWFAAASPFYGVTLSR
jgi:hypothetical protein